MSKVYINTQIEIKKLGENIRIARERRDMSASELAIKASVSRTAVIRVEKGDPTVGISKVFNILSALGLLQGLADIADPMLDRAQAIKEIKSLREGISIKKRKGPLQDKNLDF